MFVRGQSTDPLSGGVDDELARAWVFGHGRGSVLGCVGAFCKCAGVTSPPDHGACLRNPLPGSIREALKPSRSPPSVAPSTLH